MSARKTYTVRGHGRVTAYSFHDAAGQVASRLYQQEGIAECRLSINLGRTIKVIATKAKLAVMFDTKEVRK